MSLSKYRDLSSLGGMECWDVLRVQVKEILTPLLSWRLAEFFKGFEDVDPMRWDIASTGDVSGPVMAWSAHPALHPYCLFSSVLQVLCFAWLSCGCWSGLVTQTPAWLCHQAGPAAQLLALIATRDPIHFALMLLLALVPDSISPSHSLSHCGVLEMTLNAKDFLQPTEPRRPAKEMSSNWPPALLGRSEHTSSCTWNGSWFSPFA